jgi:hypothetical protein
MAMPWGSIILSATIINSLLWHEVLGPQDVVYNNFVELANTYSQEVYVVLRVGI